MKKLFVVQSDEKIVWCPPSAMTVCDALKAPKSVGDEDFKAAARDWVEDYRVCKLKQAIVADCIEKYNLEVEKKK